MEFYTCGINHCKNESDYQTILESNPGLKNKICKGSSTQTCIKLTVKVIIDDPK